MQRLSQTVNEFANLRMFCEQSQGSWCVTMQIETEPIHMPEEVPGKNNYIHLYHGNAVLLTESLEVIQKTSAVILSALEIKADTALSDAPRLAEAS